MQMSKKSIVVAAKNATAKTSNVISVNLAKFAESAAVKNASEKIANQKTTLYNYPENYTQVMINGGEGKTFRSKLRRKVESFANQIFIALRTKDAEKLQTSISAFEVFYKENYKVNDFSLQSISQKKENTESIVTMLEIIKESKK